MLIFIMILGFLALCAASAGTIVRLVVEVATTVLFPGHFELPSGNLDRGFSNNTGQRSHAFDHFDHLSFALVRLDERAEGMYVHGNQDGATSGGHGNFEFNNERADEVTDQPTATNSATSEAESRSLPFRCSLWVMRFLAWVAFVLPLNLISMAPLIGVLTLATAAVVWRWFSMSVGSPSDGPSVCAKLSSLWSLCKAFVLKSVFCMARVLSHVCCCTAYLFAWTRRTVD
eukprot:g5807.t1